MDGCNVGFGGQRGHRPARASPRALALASIHDAPLVAAELHAAERAALVISACLAGTIADIYPQR